MEDGFVARHGLAQDGRAARIDDIRQRLAEADIRLVRMAWADTHGAARAKAVTVPVFLDALVDGFNINVATFTLDGAGGRVFASFTKGGGMGLDEMTGSPNLHVVPDPATFRLLPWAPGVAWVLCDEYFPDGTPFHFSGRHLLRRQAALLADQGLGLRAGLEVEWYLMKVTDDGLTEENTGVPGRRGRPVATAPVEPGYLYHSETNLDLMQPVLGALADAYTAIGLKLRSIENEYGPGQVECTFQPGDALSVADDYVLFRTATRQVCRRMGYFASFMCRPRFDGFFSSGWHLHQSLVSAQGGGNLFMPDREGEVLSPPGRHWLAGLLNHAVPATAFAAPTVNGYRRFQPNSLAPDRATWGHDHRGALLRVLGGFGDGATRLENRAGEPAANPYLFIASQIAAGLDGIAAGEDPWPADDEPYAADRPMLPENLPAAIRALEQSNMYRDAFGATYLDYFIGLKRAEIARYEAFVAEHNADGGAVTEWEQNEYFDFF